MKKTNKKQPIALLEKKLKEDILKVIRGKSMYLSDLIEHFDAPPVKTIRIISELRAEGLLAKGETVKGASNDIGEILEVIQEISERTWCSTWMDDIEFILWGAMQEGEDFEYGGTIIKKWELMRLTQLSKEHRYWVHNTENYGIIFLRDYVWEEIYDKKRKGGEKSGN